MVRKLKYQLRPSGKQLLRKFRKNILKCFCFDRQRWQAPDVSAELVKRVIRACINEIRSFGDFMGLKRQKFSWSLLARHLYTRQLACEPQTGSLAYFSVAVRNGTQKNDQFSLSKFYIQQHAGFCFCCTSMQGQTMLKVHGNLKKGASGSMKLN